VKHREIAKAKAVAAGVNSERLWRSLEDLGSVGATEAGGVCRLAYSPAYRQGRDLFVSWCRDAGLSVSTDGIGNIFARRQGRNPQAPSIMLGSHLDSQPSGGRYDGAYGVLAGLEVARRLNDLGMDTEFPIEIVSWANEEGARFDRPLLGSSVFCGRTPLSSALALKAIGGESIEQELNDDLVWRAMPRRQESLPHAYLELHIEQGPVLEAAAVPIGIVTGTLAVRWYDVIVAGEEAHAGPTPMLARRDAMMGAAELILEARDAANRFAPHGRATVGQCMLSPGSRNVVPGEVRLSLDLRHEDEAHLDAIEESVREAGRLMNRRGLHVQISEAWRMDACKFDSALRGHLITATSQNGLAFVELPSGAGHDAVSLSTIVPTAMIFVPCLGGISHNPAESITQQQAETGADILFRTVVELAT
jgi:N-carbamoyl-L-amino-acid hydrolase